MKRHAILFALVSAAIASPLVEPPTKPKAGGPPPVTPPERGIGTGVTEKIAPPGGPPPKCNIAYTGKFGIAVQNITTKRKDVAPPAAQANLPVPTPPKNAMAPAGTPPPPPALGQDPPPPENAGTITRTHTNTVTVRRTVVGQEMKQSVYLISQIGDGQIQAPTAPTVLQRTTNVAPPAGVTPDSPKTAAGDLVSEIGDGQIQAPKPATTTPASEPKGAANAPPAVAAMSPTEGMNVKREALVPPENPATQFVACATKGTLTMTLAEGVLKDDKGRTGYIASNYQFQ